jgi:hypothetical protein
VVESNEISKWEFTSFLTSSPSTIDITVSERYLARPGRVQRLLDGLDENDEAKYTVYLRPDTMAALPDPSVPKPLIENVELSEWVRQIVSEIGDSETGATIFWTGQRATVVLPPFPVKEDHFAPGIDGSDLYKIFERNLTVGVVLLRLGKYAIGVVRGRELLASKTDTRYVKNRHRAGGSSQRRFMRSRDRLIQELYDEACDVTRRVFEPHVDAIDYVFTGGERQTINGFLNRCDFFEKSAIPVMTRLLAVDRPSHKALEDIHREIWKSRVLVFEKVE